MKYINFVLFFPLFFLIGACSEEDMHQHGDVAINIVSPDTSDKMNGDMLHIHVEFSSETTIHNISVKLMNTTDGNAIMHEYTEHVHETDGAYEYHHMMPIAVTGHADLRMEVMVSDHGGMEVGHSHVEFHVHHN